jgi:hypothetical protein
MPSGVGVGFDDPRLASLPPGGNLYYPADAALANKTPPTQSIEPVGGPGLSQAQDLYAPGGGTAQNPLTQAPSPVLMFGEGVATTGAGEPVVSAAQSSRGHWSEVLNFHGSPAPWVLLGILLVAGLLQLSASAKFGKGTP